MIKVKITTPDAFWKTINQKLKKTISEGLVDVAVAASNGAARSTFPSGTTNKTKDSLEKAIYKDINRAYFAVDSDTLDREDGEYLLKNRNHKGRIPYGVERQKIRRSDYDDIKEKLTKRAGMAKAGWLQASKHLRGTTRIPQWLRKSQDLASVTITPESVTIRNKIKYAGELITESQLKRIMINAYKGLYKRAEKMKL